MTNSEGLSSSNEQLETIIEESSKDYVSLSSTLEKEE